MNRKNIIGGLAILVVGALMAGLSITELANAQSEANVTVTATVESWASITASSTTPAFNQVLVTTGGVGQIGTATSTLTMGTNHADGLTVTIKGAGGTGDNPSELAGPGTNIVSATAGLSGGSDGYGAQCVVGTGSTCVAPYTATGDNVAVIPGGSQSAASFVTATLGTDRTADLVIKAASITTRTAGDYSDTITLTATPGL